MKKYVMDFLRRGIMACGLGPLVLAVIYLIMFRCGVIEVLTVEQVCTGIFSLSALAFIAGAMNAIFQIERLPLMLSMLIQGSVLFISYLVTYLLNDWLEWGVLPILVFTGIFVVGYLAIWLIISAIIKKDTEKLNGILKQKRQAAND